MSFIILVAVAMRLYGVSFGMPAMFDVDEPFFTMTGLKLLSEKTINPGWFGHPGTTTIYVLAAIDALVYAFGSLTGTIPNAKAFGVMIFTDPAIVALPARLFFVLCGVLCVWLTYLIGKRVYDARIGLIAAGLLAINPLHIQWSQVIRTDVHATVFMLACVFFSIRIVEDGRLRHYLAASVCVGLAAATKWPAAAVIVSPIMASLLRSRTDGSDRRAISARLAIVPAISVLSLFAVSPYLLIDYHTALANVIGEAAPNHLGATGGGFLDNLGWYLSGPMAEALGVIGLVAGGVGLCLSALRNRLALAVLISVFGLFFIILCTQSLIWARWTVPLMPFASLFVAAGIVFIGAWAGPRFGQRGAAIAQAVIFCVIAVPMVLTWRSQTIERLNDTRSLAASWVRSNLPENSSVALEYFAFDLVRGQRRVYYPAGGVGCVYANDVLRGGVHYKTTNKWRGSRAILDLGTVDRTQLDSCRASYAIFTDYDRYLAEAPLFPAEIATYRLLARGGEQLKVFRPVPGQSGGPVVRIYKLAPRADGLLL